MPSVNPGGETLATTCLTLEERAVPLRRERTPNAASRNDTTPVLKQLQPFRCSHHQGLRKTHACFHKSSLDLRYQKKSSGKAGKRFHPTCIFVGLGFFVVIAAGQNAFLQGEHEHARHFIPGRGFSRPDFKLTRGLVHKHLQPWDRVRPTFLGHL